MRVFMCVNSGEGILLSEFSLILCLLVLRSLSKVLIEIANSINFPNSCTSRLAISSVLDDVKNIK